MDVDDHERDCELGVPHHGASLTDHVPQQLQNPSPIASPARFLSQPASPLQQLPDHPFNFSFPTLNLDGSLPELQPQAPRRYPPTPPAALSSLGAKFRMANHNEHGSEAELTDSQYDMIDDLSEISNDDHDTASIASNGDEAQLTPDDAGSEADADESTLLSTDHQAHTPPSTAQSFVDIPGHARHAFESYTSDDLETPRQSTVPITFGSTYLRSIASEKDMTAERVHKVGRILFLSDQNVSRTLMDTICTSVSASMKDTDASDTSIHKVVRLPTTPSGISPHSATVVYGDDSVSATVQHCVDAEVRSQDTFKLRIMDSDQEHSSFFTVGTDAKVDLMRPDIAVFYLDEKAASMAWIATAAMAIKKLKTPVLIIHHPSVDARHPSPALRSLLRKSRDSLTMTSTDFIEKSRSDLSELLTQLGEGNLPSPKQISSADTEKGVSRRFWIFKLSILLFTCLLPNIMPWIFGVYQSQFQDPSIALATRRENLVEALSLATRSSNVSKDFNLDHLLSTKLTSPLCEGCKPTPHFQVVRPNYVVVSLPSAPRIPEVTKTKVERADGQLLAFNQSRLIDGIYLVTFDAHEAYGLVTVNMLTRKPYLNVTAPHDYGRHMLKDLSKVGADVSKAVSKDVAVMKHAARSLTEKFGTELGAGVWATKNITTQLALYVSRDLQVFSKSAASFFGKAAKAGNHTATTLSKDFVLVQRDVARFSKDLSTFVKTKVAQAKKTSKALIRDPLARSRNRFEGLQRALGRNKDAAKRKLRKEVDKVTGATKKANRKALKNSKRQTRKEAKKQKKLEKKQKMEKQKQKARVQA